MRIFSVRYQGEQALISPAGAREVSFKSVEEPVRTCVP